MMCMSRENFGGAAERSNHLMSAIEGEADEHRAKAPRPLRRCRVQLTSERRRQLGNCAGRQLFSTMQTILSDELIETRSPPYSIWSIHTCPEGTALVAMQNSNGLNMAGISHAFCQCWEPRLCENVQVLHSATMELARLQWKRAT